MTILSKYIDPATKTVFVGKEDWAALNQQYDSDFIKEQLIEEIMAGNIGFPHLDITYEDAAESFKKLCDYKCKGFLQGPTMTRYDYRYPIGDLYIDETLVGNDASNYFHQNARSEASGHNDPSPQTSWRSAYYMNSCLKGIWTLKMTTLSSKTIRSSMAMRKYWASQFRPSMAKCIYERYNSVDVLDFSSGWGDRLCGFYSCKNTRSYIGIDPNKAVYDNYFKQIELYKRIAGEKKTTFFNMPAEDVYHRPNIVDTVFTSPPYFCAETYTQDDTQSWVRYKEVDAWLNGFMYKTLQNVWVALKPGGHLIVNISDVHRKGGIQKICDPMNDYIKDKLGGELVESFGMKISKRPASAAYNGKTGTSVEPIWAWRKPENAIVLPDWIHEPTEPTPPPEPSDPTVPTIYPHDTSLDKEPTRKGNGGGGNTKKKKVQEPVTVIEAPKPPENQELHITSVWREDSKPAPTPKIEVLEKPVQEVKVVEPPKPTLPPFDIIVDSMDGIDPRSFAKLTVELKNKVDLTVVHGDICVGDIAEDIVAKLCKGLGVKQKALRGFDGEVLPQYIGKKKLVKCQAGEKPEFAIMEE